MKILITGGEGYLGNSLSCHFKKIYDVTTVGRKFFDLTSAEETSDFFKNRYFDVVIHCAVVGGSRLKKDSYKEMDSNLMMYYNLLQNKSCFAKLIHFGSGAEIFDENSPYGISKKVISNSISEIKNFYSLRIYSVFDENELNTRFIKRSIFKYLNRENIEIFEDKPMDFFYMKDLISLVDHYICNDPPKKIDCTYEKTYTLLEISKFINSLDSHKVLISVGEKHGGKYSGIFSDLGIRFIGLEEGIRRTYEKIKETL